MYEREKGFSICSSNKGQFCPLHPVFCQEGYCTKCEVYLEWQKRHSSIISKELRRVVK